MESVPVTIYGGETRPLLLSLWRGARGKCPACGEGKLFARALATEPTCSACGEELHHHRADDLPAYLNILVTGHIAVGTVMPIVGLGLMSVWPLTALAIILTVAASVLFMRPLKGMVVGAQWALRMHGFGGDED